MSTELLVNAMNQPGAYPHAVTQIKQLETHISWVFLTGKLAYKIKKPVNFGFLDFSDLEKRKHFCLRELEMNQATADHIYRRVVSIHQDGDTICIDGQGPIIEYALEMNEFSQSDLFSALLSNDALSVYDIETLSQQVAAFHAQAAIAGDDEDFGTPDIIAKPMHENFEQALPLLTRAEDRADLETIQAWSIAQHEALTPIFVTRKQTGKCRACHGDLHMGNITRMKGKIVIFDCIEFNEYFRWTDVMAEVAFLVMDLMDYKRFDYATVLLSRYLADTGDYEGLAVLPYYIVYRAMVRAKIQLFGLADANDETKATLMARYRGYIARILQVIQPSTPQLFVMHGFAGSGKTTISTEIMKHKQAIQIRSDHIRQTHFNDVTATPVALNAGIYSAKHTEIVYQQLRQFAESALRAGYSVVIDACCLKAWQRALFFDLAKQLKIPYRLIDCTASNTFLQQAVANRLQQGQDISQATEQVLNAQLHTAEPLSEDEKAHCIIYSIEEQTLQQLTHAIKSLA